MQLPLLPIPEPLPSPRRCGAAAAVLGRLAGGRTVLACERHRMQTSARFDEEGAFPGEFRLHPGGRCEWEED
jgi:hypothetical protein